MTLSPPILPKSTVSDSAMPWPIHSSAASPVMLVKASTATDRARCSGGADGKPAAGSEKSIGPRQADAVADRLAVDLAPTTIRSSPLRRARATAAPLARRWSGPVELDGAFGEIPSPTDDLAERAVWLPGVIAARWADIGDPAVARWRDRLLVAARSTSVDTVVFTHFVAINALVGAAQGTDDVTTFLPANASVTVLDVGASLDVVILGVEAPPEVG